MKPQTIITLRQSGGKLRDFPPKVATERILAILEKCHSIRGSKPKEGETSASAVELYSKLKENYGYLTIEEIENACRDGIYSSIKTVIVSPVGMYGLVREYTESDDYQVAMRKMNQIGEERQIPQSNPETEDQAARDMINNDYKYYRDNATWRGTIRCIFPRGTFCHDYLVKTGRMSGMEWRNYMDVKIRHSDIFSGLMNSGLDKDVVAKAIAYTKYIEHVADEARLKINNSVDLPQ